MQCGQIINDYCLDSRHRPETLDKETKHLRDRVEEMQKLNQQSDEAKKLLDEIKDEHQRLSKF